MSYPKQMVRKNSLLEGDMEMEQVNLGIIGFGQQDGFYGSLVTEGKVDKMAVVAVTDIDEAKDEKIKADFPNTKIYRNYKEMVNSGYGDAVLKEIPHY